MVSRENLGFEQHRNHPDGLICALWGGRGSGGSPVRPSFGAVSAERDPIKMKTGWNG